MNRPTWKRIPEPTPERLAEIRKEIQRLRALGEFFRDHDPEDSFDAGDPEQPDGYPGGGAT